MQSAGNQTTPPKKNQSKKNPNLFKNDRLIF